MPEPEYSRLTRSASRSAFGIISVSRSSLWLGRDHLLRIETSGYTENYKRFYFRDVQAIVLCPSANWIIWAIVSGLAGAGFGLVAAFAGEVVVTGIFGGIAGIFTLALLLDLAAGPSCKCYLRSAVQVEELPSLNRFRRARKALIRLRPLLVAAQGSLAPEEAPQGIPEPTVATTATILPATAPATDPGAHPSSPP